MIIVYKRDKTLYTVIKNNFDEEDFEKLYVTLQDHIKNHTKTSWYVEMEDIKYLAKSVLNKIPIFKFSREEHLKNVAFVGKVKWQEQFTELLKPFTKAQIKLFRDNEKASAKEWIINA